MFDYSSATVESLRADVARTISESDALIDQAVGATPRSWESTMGPLRQAASLGSYLGGELFLAHAHPDDDVRAACWELEEEFSKWSIGVSFRRDLYEAISGLAAAQPDLDPQDQRLLDFELRDLRRAGHGLPDEARDELRTIQERLAELGVQFAANIAEYQDHLTVTPDDLAGLPQHFVDGLKEGDEPGTLKVTMDYPDVFPVMDMAERRDIREALSRKFNNRAVETNRPVLEEAVRLRLRIAQLFDLPTWAHYKLEDRMSGGPEPVFEFWDAIVDQLTAKGRAELHVMEQLLESLGEDGPVLRSDFRFLDNLQRRTDFGVDQEKISEYFELGAVLEGMFQLTGEVFGLTYDEIDASTAWHPDVRLYTVSDRESGDLIGHFYADLFPREGKYGHAAAWGAFPAHDAGAGWVTPVTNFICNFPKPTDDRPSLLKHSDVETLFHEFGHVLHMTLSKARHPRFSGANTEWDFVEAPSQIMQHWTWKPEVLSRFARHFETGELIPRELVDQLAAARDLNVGLMALRQVAYGKLDMGMHGVSEIPDLAQLERDAEAYSLLPYQDGVFFSASFGHLFGYDASYYGYMWAEVFGDDMFSVFEEHGITNPTVGARYRREILEPNGTKDAMEMLRAFLGREPNNQAFLRHKGITAA